MEISFDMIIMIVTAIVTGIFGILTKKFEWDSSEYIPIQNILIGIISGLLVYLTGLNESIINSLIICVFSSLTAGGAYDVTKINKKEE